MKQAYSHVILIIDYWNNHSRLLNEYALLKLSLLIAILLHSQSSELNLNGLIGTRWESISANILRFYL